MPPSLPPERLLALLASERPRFERFLRSRAPNPADIDDILQQSLLRAVERGGSLRDETRVLPWFYSIIRRTLIDRVRHERAHRRRDHDWAADQVLDRTPGHAPRFGACRCVERLLARLPVLQATLLQRVEAGGERVGSVARQLGLTANRASVALHRARMRLRAGLAAACGDCAATRHCLACECGAE